ncbi:hypothetical protein V1460_13285 [Streptomyces sp. SCSIO 30461]|uniref:hypothetical protein n=1 Tax=Streptomyces sp. SCSIO 30461 TaxID=3118085 RepID=UPI0030CA649E
MATRLTTRMVAADIFDSATRLAAQCFLTAIPLLFVVGSFAPGGVPNRLMTSVQAVFGLTGPARVSPGAPLMRAADAGRAAAD